MCGWFLVEKRVPGMLLVLTSVSRVSTIAYNHAAGLFYGDSICPLLRHLQWSIQQSSPKVHTSDTYVKWVL